MQGVDKTSTHPVDPLIGLPTSPRASSTVGDTMPTPIQPKPPELMAVTGHEEEEMNAIREEAIKFNIFNLFVW